MFICQLGKHVSEAGEKLHKVVTETRDRNYSDGGFGFETVREIDSCHKCALKQKGEDPVPGTVAQR